MSQLTSKYSFTHCFKKYIKKFSALAGAFIIAAALTASAVNVNINDALAADKEVTYKFPDLNLKIKVPSELVCFTRNVTSNDPNLELIGADNAEELRTLMQINNIYFEAVPHENVNYEIIIDGKELTSKEVTNLSALSEDELREAFSDYTSGIDKKNDDVTETLISSEIRKINDATYFVTTVDSVSKNLVAVKILKYYTIMNGRYITFTLQTTSNTITDTMQSQLNSIILSAEYPEVMKKSIFDNMILSELSSSIFVLLIPIAFLGLILFLLIKINNKSKKRGY